MPALEEPGHYSLSADLVRHSMPSADGLPERQAQWVSRLLTPLCDSLMQPAVPSRHSVQFRHVGAAHFDVLNPCGPIHMVLWAI